MQIYLYRSDLPLPSPELTSHLCVLYSESFLTPAYAIFFPILYCFSCKVHDQNSNNGSNVFLSDQPMFLITVFFCLPLQLQK